MSPRDRIRRRAVDGIATSQRWWVRVRLLAADSRIFRAATEHLIVSLERSQS